MTSGADAVLVRDVTKRFGGTTALDGFDLRVGPAEMVALLGPSGCGKTTALRVIAGFERPGAGWVEIAGRRVATASSSVPPERRRVGLVFQDFALFPHLDVRENVRYGVRSDPDGRVRVDELLELVGLRGQDARLPHELSGGMQQRVALARALAPRPDVLLLDEPFSNLDQAHRTQLRVEVREILRQARQAAVFVTHDQAEALTIADRVAVMARGRIEQTEAPEVIYAEPATPFVAGFVGVANLVPAMAADGVARTRFGPLRLVGPLDRRPTGRALCLLRPEHFELREAPDGPADPDGWEIVDRRFSGSEILLEVRSGDGERLWVEAGDRLRTSRIGDRVHVSVRAVDSVAFPAAPGGPSGAVMSVGSAGRQESGERAPTGADVPVEPEAVEPPVH